MVVTVNTQQVIIEYIRTLDVVTDYETTLLSYPAMLYPESLLPYPKSVINQSLREAKEVAFIRKDYELVQLIDWATHYLDAFVDECQAYRENWKRLTN